MALMICAECKGQVSSTAPSCPHCGALFKPPLPPAVPADTKSRLGRGVIVLILIGLAIAGLNALDGGSSKAPSNTAVSMVPGAEVTLRVPSGQIPVAVSEAASDRLIQLLTADDTQGIYELTLADQVFFVQSGTRAKVIGQKSGAREVRILERPVLRALRLDHEGALREGGTHAFYASNERCCCYGYGMVVCPFCPSRCGGGSTRNE